MRPLLAAIKRVLFILASVEASNEYNLAPLLSLSSLHTHDARNMPSTVTYQKKLLFPRSAKKNIDGVLVTNIAVACCTMFHHLSRFSIHLNVFLWRAFSHPLLPPLEAPFSLSIISSLSFPPPSFCSSIEPPQEVTNYSGIAAAAAAAAAAHNRRWKDVNLHGPTIGRDHGRIDFRADMRKKTI